MFPAPALNNLFNNHSSALWAYGYDGNSISVEAPEGGLSSYVGF
jgi:hypothetical protein